MTTTLPVTFAAHARERWCERYTGAGDIRRAFARGVLAGEVYRRAGRGVRVIDPHTGAVFCAHPNRNGPGWVVVTTLPTCTVMGGWERARPASPAATSGATP